MSSDLNLVIIVNQADANSGEYPVQLWHDGKPLADARARIDHQALLTHEHAYNAHDYGMELYDALFIGAVGRAYQRLIGKAGAEATVRVQLVIHPAAHELHALPWERLFHVFGDTDTPLTTSAQTPFSRFLTTGAGDQAPVSDRPLHLLLAIANPENLPAELSTLDVAGEAKALADLLAGLPRKVVGTVLPGRTGLPDELQSKLTKAGWTVANGVTSWQNIQRHLQDGQHILHILAHGQLSRDGKAYLLLEHEGGEKVARGSLERVPDQTIVTSLAGVRPLPQLIFLAACESAKRPANQANPFVGLAPKLVESGVPAVVAMQDLVPIPLAHLLTVDFYRRLFEHGQVDRALNEARTLLYKQNAFEWAIPVLFLRLKNGQLFASQDLVPSERVRFDGLIEEYTQLFAGRDAAIAELETFMQNPAGGYLLVTAGAGLGKTALMANLVARHRDTLAYHFFSPRISESLQEAVFLRNLLEQIEPWFENSVRRPEQSDQLRYDDLLGKSPQGIHTVILDGLDEITGWELGRYLTRRLPAGLHFILTVRDVGQDAVEIYSLPAEQVQMLPICGLDREGVQAVLRAVGRGATQFAEDDELLDQVLRVTTFDQSRPALGADTLFVRFLAEDLATGDVGRLELTTLPSSMQAYLKRWYLSRWYDAIRTELGTPGRAEFDQAMLDLIMTLAVALGPIARADLQTIYPTTLAHPIFKRFFDELVNRVRKVLVVGSDGTYSLLHPRLRGYLQEMIETQPYEDRLIEYCAQWHQHKSRYALTYYAAHLARAVSAARQPERHRLTELVVRLVTNKQFQDTYLAIVEDLRGLQTDLQRALEASVGDDTPDALPLLVESALSLVSFRHARLRPERLFDLAAQGDIAGARHMLELFEMDRKWQQIARLAISWLAGTGPSSATRNQAYNLRLEVATAIHDLPEDDQRKLLLRWIEADLDGAVQPQGGLPWAPTTVELRAMLNLAAGVSSEADVSPEMMMPLSGLNWNLLANGATTVSEVDEMSEDMFFSYYIGPKLVALVLADPTSGEQYLKEYFGVHSAYNYANYRFGSLWALLRPILQYPQAEWIKEKVRALLSSALGGSSTEFEEGTPVTVLALRAAAGESEAAKSLADYATRVRQEARELSLGRDRGDTWGRYKRLLATLAQVEAILGVDVGTPNDELLHDAVHVHYGYAGYQAPACLALAEAIRICHPPEADNWITWTLESAQQAAHNVQEGTFCVRTTARINAMRANWWSLPSLDVRAESLALRNHPQAKRFSALHYMNHAYPGRSDPPRAFPLPPRVKDANTLTELAKAYQRGLPEFLRLNRQWAPDQVIPAGERIYVPDPGLAPWLAARLAAEALVATGLTKPQRADIIRQLVPVATPNATALDSVLARLMLAESPTDPTILAKLAAFVPLPQAVQSTNGKTDMQPIAELDKASAPAAADAA